MLSPAGSPESDDPPPKDASSNQQPLRSVSTANFSQILAAFGGSLIVTTYQAGKVVLLRRESSRLNTHFRPFQQPMGCAVGSGRLAIGGGSAIWEYHNVPATARRIEPAGSHDAAYLPRRMNVTGEVRIHEMAWIDDPADSGGNRSTPELWFVNTEFSCLAVRSDAYSFEPRWRPSFVSHLQPGDRCHLNGLGVRDGRARYVSALGVSDEPGGWRKHKRDGGVLIDVEANEILARGLSMPHSPRWYRDRLWVLNSGAGGFGTVDPQTGRYEEVARLPGFTRGLTFAGDLAFIGLSQVRESAVFSGIPLCDGTERRRCGVWAVHIETGAIVAFVEFTDAVQEIFAVEALPGARCPDLVYENWSLVESSYVLSDDALRDVPAALRSDGAHEKSPGGCSNHSPA